MADEGAPAVYVRVTSGERLYMGEILADVVERQVVTDPASGDLDAREIPHGYAVIVSQDCDLEQDATARADSTLDEKSRENALVPHVLLLVASTVDVVKKRSVSSRQWERVRMNKEERFQFLSGIPVDVDNGETGLPALVLDFKRFFSFPTEELLRRIACTEVRRRARLATPYAEHLAVRFGFFLQRVGLTREHYDLERSAPGALVTPPALPPRE